MGQPTIGSVFEESTSGTWGIIGESFGTPGDLLGAMGGG